MQHYGARPQQSSVLGPDKPKAVRAVDRISSRHRSGQMPKVSLRWMLLYKPKTCAGKCQGPPTASLAPRRRRHLLCLQVDSFSSWGNLFHRDQLIKMGPALGSTLVLYLTMHFSRSPLALPGVLLCIPLIFHAVLLGKGLSLEQAADAGWVMHAQVRCRPPLFRLTCSRIMFSHFGLCEPPRL